MIFNERGNKLTDKTSLDTVCNDQSFKQVIYGFIFPIFALYQGGPIYLYLLSLPFYLALNCLFVLRYLFPISIKPCKSYSLVHPFYLLLLCLIILSLINHKFTLYWTFRNLIGSPIFEIILTTIPKWWGKYLCTKHNSHP